MPTNYREKLQAASQALDLSSSRMKYLAEDNSRLSAALKSIYHGATAQFRFACGLTTIDVEDSEVESLFLDPDTINVCNPDMMADHILMAQAMICSALAAAHTQLNEVNSHLVPLEGRLLDNEIAREHSVPSPLLRSYSLLCKTLESLKGGVHESEDRNHIDSLRTLTSGSLIDAPNTLPEGLDDKENDTGSQPPSTPEAPVTTLPSPVKPTLPPSGKKRQVLGQVRRRA
jgi:hypothetical protein